MPSGADPRYATGPGPGGGVDAALERLHQVHDVAGIRRHDLRPALAFSRLLLLACAAAGLLVAAAQAVDGSGKPAAPIYGVTVPDGYRDWRLIAPALEDAPLNELRAVVGDDRAVAAYRDGMLPFPDGTVLVKLAWERMPSTAFESATVPGRATTVQIMVKDAKRYVVTGGWGFGRFIDGQPVDEAQHQTCFACHEAWVRNHDFVFTRYAR